MRNDTVFQLLLVLAALVLIYELVRPRSFSPPSSYVKKAEMAKKGTKF